MTTDPSPSSQNSPTGAPGPSSPAPDAGDDLAPGTLLGKYRIVRRIGAGGMGVVYEASDSLLKRKVAIKVLPGLASDLPELHDRFRREALAVARLNHPNVVSVYDVGREGDVDYIVMEYVEGENVQALLAAKGAFPWRRATRVLQDLCRAAAAAHSAGLIHRDIKPGNVMLDTEGHAKLTDFGLVKRLDSTTATLTHAGSVLGTPHYMSPEQCRGQTVDARSDIYSLGATFYALLTGRPPFSADVLLAIMFAHCENVVPDPRATSPGVPEACTSIVRKAMEKVQARRYLSAMEMLADLQAALEGGKVSPPAESLAPTVKVRQEGLPARAQAMLPRRRSAPRSPWLTILAGGAAMLALGAIIAHLTNARQETPGGTRIASATAPPASVDRAPTSVSTNGSREPSKSPAQETGSAANPAAGASSATDPPKDSPPGRDAQASVPPASKSSVSNPPAGKPPAGDPPVSDPPVVKPPAAPPPAGNLQPASSFRKSILAAGRDLTLKGPARAVAFSPNGKLLAAGSTGGECGVTVWDFETGEERVQRWQGEQINSVAFSRDSQLLAAGGVGQILVWDLVRGREHRIPTRGKDSPVFSVAFSKDGKTIAAGLQPRDPSSNESAREDCVLVADVATGKCRLLPCPMDWCWSVDFSPKGDFLVASSLDWSFRVWDFPALGRPREVMTEQNLTWVAVAPEGRRLGVAGLRSIQVWDLASGTKAGEVSNPHEGGSCIAWSPDGSMLAAGDDRGMTVWSADLKKALATMDVQGGAVQGVAFSPDGAVLAAACVDRTVRLRGVSKLVGSR